MVVHLLPCFFFAFSVNLGKAKSFHLAEGQIGHHQMARAGSLPLSHPSPFSSCFSPHYSLFLFSILSVHTVLGSLPISGTAPRLHVKLPQWYLMLKDYNRLSVLSSSAQGDLWMEMEKRIMIIFTITAACSRFIIFLTLSSSFFPGISCQGKAAPSHPALEWSDKSVRKLMLGAIFCLVNSFHWYIH